MANVLNNLFNMKIMPDTLMTLRDLRVQAFKERREGRLTKLSNNFYSRLKQLEANIRQFIDESKDNSPKLGKANGDIRKFLDMKLDLHKHRERKLTDLARERINGQNPNTANVHPNETEYLTSLCDIIEAHRKKTLLGEIIIDDIESEKPVEKLEEEIEPVEKLEEEYIEVEVLEDLPTFTGMDAKNYTLKNNNKEIIPIYNAKILSDAGKVKMLTEVKA